MSQAASLSQQAEASQFVSPHVRLPSWPSIDFVPRSRFGGSRTKKGGGGGERRKRDLAKYESKRVLISCSILHAEAPRACFFLSLAVPKDMLKTFYRAKKKLSQLCLTLTEHDKMYLIFSDTDRAVKLESLIKTLRKIYFSGEDGLFNHNTIFETVTEHY